MSDGSAWYDDAREGTVSLADTPAEEAMAEVDELVAEVDGAKRDRAPHRSGSQARRIGAAVALTVGAFVVVTIAVRGSGEEQPVSAPQIEASAARSQLDAALMRQARDARLRRRAERREQSARRAERIARQRERRAERSRQRRQARSSPAASAPPPPPPTAAASAPLSVAPAPAPASSSSDDAGAICEFGWEC